MRLIVLIGEAAGDLTIGQLFYNEQEDFLGDRFYDSVSADIEKLDELAGVHAKRFGFHRMIATEFPFGIYYRVEPKRVVVFGVLDLRAEPNSIARTLRTRG